MVSLDIVGVSNEIPLVFQLEQVRVEQGWACEAQQQEKEEDFLLSHSPTYFETSL